MTHSFSYMAHPEKTSARQSRAYNGAMSNAKAVLAARGLRSARLVGQADGGEGRPDRAETLHSIHGEAHDKGFREAVKKLLEESG